ncbi:MAG: TetR/AcrR family transcriptional regulator C-terminal ligand-binding domain-containing protein [Ilumatobacteraceae bacterium]
MGTDVAATRPGRRRDPEVDAAILDAALALFAEGGYRGVTIEGVAARSGVGKASVYRRYPTHQALVVDAMRVRLCLIHDLVDTGDLRADLLAMLGPLIDRLSGPQGPMMIAFMCERLREPELAEEWQRSVIGHKREHVRGLVRGAIARGEFPADTDVELVAELPAAMVWHHALNGLPVDRALAERIVDHLLR